MDYIFGNKLIDTCLFLPQTANEVPLIADEIDVTPWKNLLMKFAQVHVCLEHLFRAQVCLRSNFGTFYEFCSLLVGIKYEEIR